MNFKGFMAMYYDTMTDLSKQGYQVKDSGISKQGDVLYAIYNASTGKLISSNLTIEELQSYRNGEDRRIS